MENKGQGRRTVSSFFSVVLRLEACHQQGSKFSRVNHKRREGVEVIITLAAVATGFFKFQRFTRINSSGLHTNHTQYIYDQSLLYFKEKEREGEGDSVMIYKQLSCLGF